MQNTPTYTVTIPETVTLGGTVKVSAQDVMVGKGEQLKVALTETSEPEGAFTVTSVEGAEIVYTVLLGQEPVSAGGTVLAVNPDFGDSGSAALTFAVPENLVYAGDYTGSVTFTVRIGNVDGEENAENQEVG